MFDWLWKMTKTKDERQFEILDERLLNIQGKLKNLTVGLKQQLLAVNQKLDAQAGNAANLALIMEKLNLIHGLLANADNSTELQKQIDELTEQLNSSTATLKGEIDQQTKEKS